MKVFKLAVRIITDETSETIGSQLADVGNVWNITDKVIGFAGDNCNTNFGGVKRLGQKNVFYRLKQILGRNLVGVGCASHIIHNAFDYACEQLPFLIEPVVVRTYKHFHIFTKRVEALKEICDDAGVVYKKLENHSGTRFLSLHPAVKKVKYKMKYRGLILMPSHNPQIIAMFEPLTTYFQDMQNCPVSLSEFYESESSLFWLTFLECQLKLSNEYVLRSETKTGTAFEISSVINELRDIVGNRQIENYLRSDAKELLLKLTPRQQPKNLDYVKKFYEALSSYLEKWSESLDGNEVFAWMSLTAVPDWDREIRPSLTYAIDRIGPDIIDADAVFDEIVLLKQYVTNSLDRWTENKSSSETRWLDAFKSLSQQSRPIKEISLLVQFAFSIPGSSTEVERLFSYINDVWSEDKPQMKHNTLEAQLNIKVNSDLDCVQFYNSIKNNRKILAQVKNAYKDTNNESQNSNQSQEEPSAVPAMEISDDDE